MIIQGCHDWAGIGPRGGDPLTSGAPFSKSGAPAHPRLPAVVPCSLEVGDGQGNKTCDHSGGPLWGGPHVACRIKKIALSCVTKGRCQNSLAAAFMFSSMLQPNYIVEATHLSLIMYHLECSQCFGTC